MKSTKAIAILPAVFLMILTGCDIQFNNVDPDSVAVYSDGIYRNAASYEFYGIYSYADGIISLTTPSSGGAGGTDSFLRVTFLQSKTAGGGWSYRADSGRKTGPLDFSKNKAVELYARGNASAVKSRVVLKIKIDYIKADGSTSALDQQIQSDGKAAALTTSWTKYSIPMESIKSDDRKKITAISYTIENGLIRDVVDIDEIITIK